ncbi:MAG: hypothetical protein H6739_01940 [Alphaproteobacteria bacterium]|nr:hypothetical protein [Alphaproteobacteria bacterium]
MTLLLLAAAALAQDDTGEPTCSELEVRDLIPHLHTDLVPLDIQPMVIFNSKPCTLEQDFTLTLFLRTEEGDAVELASTTLTSVAVPPTSAMALPLDFELDPDTRYRFRVQRFADADGEVIAQVDFLTGTARIAGVDGAPGAPDLPIAWRYRTDGGFRVQLGGSVAAALDPDDLSVLQLLNDADEVVETAPVFGTTPVAVFGSWIQGDKPKEVCLRAVQIDGAGRAGDAGPEACVAPARGQCEGCGGVGGAGGLAVLLASLGLLRRRSPP